MNGKTVVVLGGGVGGIMTATELMRRMPSDSKVVVVERNAIHAFPPSFLWVMTGARTAGQVTREVRRMVPAGAELMIGAIGGIDTTRRQVNVDGRPLDYDYLVLALGAELAPELIPGLGEAAETFYTLDGAVKLAAKLGTFRGGTVAVLVAGLPYKCPAAPHEGAMLIADLLRRNGHRDRSAVHLYTPEPQPMPGAGPAAGESISQVLAAKGVTFHPQQRITSVDAAARQMRFDGLEPVNFDLLVAIPPHRSPAVVRDAGLTDRTGWVPVDRFTLQTAHEHVYAIGDVAGIAVPGHWKPDVPLMLPKAGVFAHSHARVVAERIAAQVAGRTPESQASGVGYCMLEMGGGIAGFAAGDFYAEPAPAMMMNRPAKRWHVGKVLFEKWWLSPPGLKRSALGWALDLGSHLSHVPGS